MTSDEAIRATPTLIDDSPPDPGRPPRPGGPRPLRRWLLGLVVGLLTAAALVLTLNLQTPFPVGVSDNADGARLYCAARLAPDTPEGTAAWREVVVTTFRTDGPPCVEASDPPSSATVLLKAAVALPGPAPLWSLRWLALLSVALVAAGAGLAAVAASATSYRRAAVVLLPLLGLVAVPWWSRFFVSTYTDPAGLLGGVWLLLGLGVLAVTSPAQRWSRLAGLGLLGAGGVVAGTAKPGFLPLLLGAAAVAALVVVRGRRDGPRAGRWAWRAAGPVAAVLVLAVGAGPVAAGLEWQRGLYASTNTHDLVFTVVLPALGPDATGPLGLPRAAADRSGEGFYVSGGQGIPGWEETIGRDPDRVRAAALGLLARRPGIVVAAVDAGLVATMRPQLPYLTSTPRGAIPDFSVPPRLHPDSPQYAAPLLAYLDTVPLGRLPLAVVLLSVVAGLATLLPGVRRGIGAPATGLARAAAAGALIAVGVVGAAVLGDGLYELTKHVWLASYLLLTSGLTLLAAGVVTLDHLRRRL